MSLINNNFSSFKNIQDLLNIYNNIAVKSKRNRIYFDEENHERIVNSANRKRLIFKKSIVEQNIKKMKSSSSSDFYSFSQSTSVERTFKKITLLKS